MKLITDSTCKRDKQTSNTHTHDHRYYYLNGCEFDSVSNNILWRSVDNLPTTPKTQKVRQWNDYYERIDIDTIANCKCMWFVIIMLGVSLLLLFLLFFCINYWWINQFMRYSANHLYKTKTNRRTEKTTTQTATTSNSTSNKTNNSSAN